MGRLVVFTLLMAAMLFLVPLNVQAQGLGLLQEGSRGTEVVQLQTKLNVVGYNVGKADGIFGSMTRNGVINYQKAHGLVADGIVGAWTNNSLTSNSVVATSKKYIGVRYQWGGSTPSTGFDCSGFTSYIFAWNGIDIPRVSKDQFGAGVSVGYGNLRTGDLVFFATGTAGVVNHVGIYIGNGQFINASTSKGVTIYSLAGYWSNVYMGARQVIN